MKKLLSLVLLSIAAVLASLAAPASADQADIDAAKRGVVRIIILANTANGIQFLGYGSGFAVSPDTLVTNAHVIIEAAEFPNVVAVIIPPEGEEVALGRVIARDEVHDLALLRIEGDLRLPPLAILSDYRPDGEEELVAIGYPNNVETAIADGSPQDYARAITQPKPAPASRGFFANTEIDGDQTDYLLHSATIAPGNSGGPLVDPCGRVAGVNVAGTSSTGGGGDFFFAIQNVELLPLLRENNIEPVLSDFPCRSREDAATARTALREASAEARRSRIAAIETEIENEITAARDQIGGERTTLIAIGSVLILLAMGAGGFAVFTLTRQKSAGGRRGTSASTGSQPVLAYVAAGAGVLMIMGAIGAFVAMPSENEAEDRVSTRVAQLRSSLQGGGGGLAPGELVCTLAEDASIIRSAPPREVRLNLSSSGCEGSDQYASRDGAWERVFVPGEGYSVRRAVIDPATGEYRSAIYLLGQADLSRARSLASASPAPSCSADGAAQQVAGAQDDLIALLPAQPNEDWLYTCENG